MVLPSQHPPAPHDRQGIAENENRSESPFLFPPALHPVDAGRRLQVRETLDAREALAADYSSAAARMARAAGGKPGTLIPELAQGYFFLMSRVRGQKLLHMTCYTRKLQKSDFTASQVLRVRR